jgi:hypothetical protein
LIVTGGLLRVSGSADLARGSGPSIEVEVFRVVKIPEKGKAEAGPGAGGKERKNRKACPAGFAGGWWFLMTGLGSPLDLVTSLCFGHQMLAVSHQV